MSHPGNALTVNRIDLNNALQPQSEQCAARTYRGGMGAGILFLNRFAISRMVLGPGPIQPLHQSPPKSYV